jgi:hypothetical protein
MDVRLSRGDLLTSSMTNNDLAVSAGENVAEANSLDDLHLNFRNHDLDRLEHAQGSFILWPSFLIRMSDPVPRATSVPSEQTPVKPKRRYVGSSTRPARGKTAPGRRVVNSIPEDILNDKALNAAIAGKHQVTRSYINLE